MECANCRFNNMPGSEVCGRCGTSLRLAAAAIDVHPPRATAFSKRFRRALPLRRWSGNLRETLEEMRVSANARRSALLSLPPGPLLGRLVVPGWAHLYSKQRWQGWSFLAAWLLFMLPGLFNFGTIEGSVLLGLAFGVHSAAAYHIVSSTFPECDQARQMLRSTGVSVMLGVCVYLPAAFLLTRVADPSTVLIPQRAFEPNDVVLVNHWSRLVPGQVVLYALPRDFRAPAGSHRLEEFTGERIDRILAGPGATAYFRGGRLWVNGAVSQWRPLGSTPVPDTVLFTVPENSYLIVPSTLPVGPAADALSTWQDMSYVPAALIRGRVYARAHPFSRFRWIR